MARKRAAFTALDDDADRADRAYALSVAAAMAASEEEIVHTPSVKKKQRKPTANGIPNGRPKQQVPPTARPTASPAKAPRPSPNQLTHTKPVVKKEKKVKHESTVPVEPIVEEYEEESDAVYAEDEFEDEELQEELQEDEDEDEEEEEEIAAPVVFQCATCRSIFGDSYSFICSNAELLLVTLSSVTNISLSPEPHTSRDPGADRGSSFHELLCKQCQTVLGRQYLTTPPALDAIRSLYSFSTTAIASYQLGYPQLSQVENGTSDTLPSIHEIKKSNQSCDEAVRVLSADRNELLKLRDEMTKVQSLLVVVDERLHQLETQAEDSEQEQDHDDEDFDESRMPAASTVHSQQQPQRRPAVTSHRNRPF